MITSCFLRDKQDTHDCNAMISLYVGLKQSYQLVKSGQYDGIWIRILYSKTADDISCRVTPLSTGAEVRERVHKIRNTRPGEWDMLEFMDLVGHRDDLELMGGLPYNLFRAAT
jgi:hypothetical protein